LRFPYKAGDTKITGQGKKVAELPATLPNNHWTRNLLLSKEGTLLVSVGSNSNIGENGMDSEKGRAAIHEIDLKTGQSRLYAHGLRNPTGLALEPKTGYIWTTVNERDMLGSDGPPDYLTTVEFGTFYGWPWYYWGKYEDYRTETKRPDLRQYSRRPNYSLGPHTASLGIDFADGAKLGDAFTNGVFVAQHGSWNRVPVSGYKVVYIPFNERGFPDDNARPIDVLTGFLNAKGDAMGRPAGVLVTPDGALLVADDSGNRIWRVSAEATAP
jgi:glucose/arabinose dehydrogenase